MGVNVRPASLQDGLAILDLLENVGYYPEPIAFAPTYRKTLTDPHFLVRVAEVEGKVRLLAMVEDPANVARRRGVESGGRARKRRSLRIEPRS